METQTLIPQGIEGAPRKHNLNPVFTGLLSTVIVVPDEIETEKFAHPLPLPSGGGERLGWAFLCFMTYAEKLRDPRWQKKRLEIMELDGWKCRICGDVDSTLHTHHLYYKRGREPWDYPNESLICLCETCHEKQFTFPSFSVSDIEEFTIAVESIQSERRDDMILAQAEMIKNHRHRNARK